MAEASIVGEEYRLMVMGGATGRCEHIGEHDRKSVLLDTWRQREWFVTALEKDIVGRGSETWWSERAE